MKKQMLKFDHKFGIIGIGNIGYSILKSTINNNVFSNKNIFIYDLDVEKIGVISKEFKINIAKNVKELIEKTDIILIAVKPNNLNVVLESIKKYFSLNKIIISTVAGAKISSISDNLEFDKLKIVRIMPNTPILINEGMIAISYSREVSKTEKNIVENLFKKCGEITVIDEKYMDIVTAISGSGPAYMFLILEALANAGVKNGLDYKTSLKLAVQTMSGSSKMVKELNEHPAILKDRVTSPGGTTAEGLFVLEKNNLRSSIMEAVTSACNKSQNLDKK